MERDSCRGIGTKERETDYTKGLATTDKGDTRASEGRKL